MPVLWQFGLSAANVTVQIAATGIEKTFRKQPEVATVKVDLPKKLVTITTKPGKTLTDAKIKEVVTFSGYAMGKIVRKK